MVVDNTLWVAGRAGGVDRDRRVLHVDLGKLREDLFFFNTFKKCLVDGKISAAVLDDIRDSVLWIFGRKR